MAKTLTKKQRIALYQRLHEDIKHHYRYRGICNALKDLGHSGKIEELPELWAKKLKIPYNVWYWFPSDDVASRLRAIEGAIALARQK